MPVYTFSAAIDGLDLSDTAQLANLHTEEMDIYPSSIDDAVSLEFEVDAECGEEAVRRAFKHLNATVPHVRVTRLDEGLVNATDISERLSVSRETVRLWATGARRAAFPRPRATVSGGLRLWTWASVFAWAEATGRAPAGEPIPLDDSCVDFFNGQLATHGVLIRESSTMRASTFEHVVADRQHGIVSRWGTIAAEAAHDEFRARDGSQWMFVGRGNLLQTANRARER
ncbi:hypothetical protein [Cellulosimicrobium composti]|uniref:hypothetical protein n=1 Tax=Cellulosimicrobium composti TaxID=2672572 RepID=UPI0037A963C5